MTIFLVSLGTISTINLRNRNKYEWENIVIHLNSKFGQGKRLWKIEWLLGHDAIKRYLIFQ